MLTYIFRICKVNDSKIQILPEDRVSLIAILKNVISIIEKSDRSYTNDSEEKISKNVLEEENEEIFVATINNMSNSNEDTVNKNNQYQVNFFFYIDKIMF